MRSTLRALARHFEAGTPTGLTGLRTHATPRSTLLYLYSSTLDRLQSLPETSLYRQSVEAVTRHRLALVEAVTPPGYDDWAARVRDQGHESAEQVQVDDTSGRGGRSSKRGISKEARTVKLGDRTFVVRHRQEIVDTRVEEWDGEKEDDTEGMLTAEEYAEAAKNAEAVQNAGGTLGKGPEPVSGWKPRLEGDKAEVEEQPQLTAEQIEELEHKIGAGLIEEVIEVAEGELKIIGVMEKAMVWEDLEEKPVQGQWTYFDRT